MRIIRGKYGKRRFDVPKNITARPTTDFARENLFNIIENIEDLEEKSVLDLFAGTGAVSWEFVSRGASPVVAVEQAQVQSGFIRSVKEKLKDEALRLVKGDVFKYLERSKDSYDIIFADPPYDHPRFAEIPELILKSPASRQGTLVIVEHNRNHDFSRLPGFMRHLVYGSVNFSLFRVEEGESVTEAEEADGDGEA
ncbi:MAG: methyltransferase [Bacteroidales bacterium]|nr:methyltransferase [Bacteroidales bacterium]MDE6537253.1 RsmD family RNA methyltransferase [Muribaculaceae bacterium]